MCYSHILRTMNRWVHSLSLQQVLMYFINTHSWVRNPAWKEYILQVIQVWLCTNCTLNCWVKLIPKLARFKQCQIHLPIGVREGKIRGRNSKFYFPSIFLPNFCLLFVQLQFFPGERGGGGQLSSPYRCPISRTWHVYKLVYSWN